MPCFIMNWINWYLKVLNFSGLSENLGMWLKQVHFNYAYQLLASKKLVEIYVDLISRRKKRYSQAKCNRDFLKFLSAFVNYPW